jgi:hypothetical protein
MSQPKRTNIMTINEIYATYTVGSQGFCKAVETHCGYSVSISFQSVWENNDDSWTDAKNAA